MNRLHRAWCRMFGHLWAPMSWLDAKWICRRCHTIGREMPK
jgi:hypothetical protein